METEMKILPITETIIETMEKEIREIIEKETEKITRIIMEITTDEIKNQKQQKLLLKNLKPSEMGYKRSPMP
ncbi:MAG: hypothetical protein K6E76_08590 [Patescibacteria group bacterium]|nr:hypothetical protein [Patescibacteria group bacterium]